MPDGDGSADSTRGREARKPGADHGYTGLPEPGSMTPSHHITRLMAVALAVGALAAPAAIARPATDHGTFSGDNAAAVEQAVAAEPGGISGAPVVEQIDTGIDWGSVALGAGIGGMVVLLAAAGSMTYRRHHDHVPLAR